MMKSQNHDYNPEMKMSPQPSRKNAPPVKTKYSQSMVSAGFMRSQISEVIPEENTVSMNETDQTMRAMSEDS
jgi:hypothetical protein